MTIVSLFVLNEERRSCWPTKTRQKSLTKLSRCPPLHSFIPCRATSSCTNFHNLFQILQYIFTHKPAQVSRSKQQRTWILRLQSSLYVVFSCSVPGWNMPLVCYCLCRVPLLLTGNKSPRQSFQHGVFPFHSPKLITYSSRLLPSAILLLRLRRTGTKIVAVMLYIGTLCTRMTICGATTIIASVMSAKDTDLPESKTTKRTWRMPTMPTLTFTVAVHHLGCFHHHFHRDDDPRFFAKDWSSCGNDFDENGSSIVVLIKGCLLLFFALCVDGSATIKHLSISCINKSYSN